MIWFAITVVVTISLVAVFVGIAYDYSAGMRNSARQRAANYYVDIEIINDPAMVPYNENTNEITLYVKNTGSYRLDTSQILMSVSGEALYLDENQVTILGNNSQWTSGTVAEMRVSSSTLQIGRDHYVWIEVQGIYGGNIMGRGQDTFEFHFNPEGD